MTALLLALAMGGCIAQGNTRDAKEIASAICDERGAVKASADENAGLTFDLSLIVTADRADEIRAMPKGEVRALGDLNCEFLFDVAPHARRFDWVIRDPGGDVATEGKCRREKK